MSDAGEAEATGQGEAHDATPEQARSLDRRRARARRQSWIRAVAGILFLLASGAAAFVSQTATGQRFVVDEVLARVRNALAGELAVGEVRSQTLLAGVSFSDVRLTAEGGAPVLSADSVVLRYSLLSLLVGSPRVRSTTLYGMDLEVTRSRGEEALNVERILLRGESSGDSTSGAPNPLELGRISVRGGHIAVLIPTDETGRTTVAAPDGTPLQRLAFGGVDLDLEETVLRSGGAAAFDARLASFSATVQIVEQPVVVQAAVGDLTFGDDGLRIAEGTFRLPGSLLEGSLGFGPEQPSDSWIFTADLRADDWSDLGDLAWIDERIPAGDFRGAAQLRTGSGLTVALRELRVRTGESDVVATGGARFAENMTLSAMMLRASPVAVTDIEPWADRDIPLDGMLSGEATFSGTVRALEANGRLTFVPTTGSATTAEFRGTLFTGTDPGADSLFVRLDPFDYHTVAGWWPRAEVLGTGSGTLELDGRADDGILLSADFTHFSDIEPTSRVSARGVVRRVEAGVWTTDVQGELAPLAIGLVTRFRPVEGLRGTLAGPVRVAGPFSDLRFGGELVAGNGRLTLDGSVDLTELGSAYALDLDAEGVSLAHFTDRAPEPSLISGHVVLEGSGLTLDSLQGSASLVVRPSRIGLVRLRAASADVRAAAGMLEVDTVEVDVSGARATGMGTIGLTPDANGRATLAFAIDSLVSLRPMIMGDSILVRDGLSALEQDLLRVRGIEPDTLPDEIDVRLGGSAYGTADLRGHIRDLGIDLSFQAREVAYRANAVDSASVTLSASGLPDFSGDWTADVRAQGITWEERTFEAVDFDGVMSRQRGEGTLSIQRRPEERYFLTGAFAVDSIGGELALAAATIQIDDLAWVLERPGRIAWDDASVRVDSMELVRVGEDPARVVARGTLARGGDSNFRLDLEGFHVEDATRILQREDIDISGHIDLSLTVLGPAESPTVNALFEVVDPRYGALQLTRLSGAVDYLERASEFRVDAWDGERIALSAIGTLPYDLALADVEQRRLDEPMDIRVTADSLDAGIPLAYFGSLENVTGMLFADLRMVGTSREPEPSGTIRLSNGAWTIAALGVRHTGLQGELDVRPDRTVGVRLETSGGRSNVTGVLAFDSIANPGLDLVVTLDQFQAVNRRDIESMLSGSFTVRGAYQLPVAEGQLRVDQGTLFVEEFARSANVVDLRDPMLFAEGFAVDTTVFVTQPILAGLRNPFLDNLRVDIDLSVPRDLWIRSDEMNVEIGGDLIVRYDRRQNDLVMVGDLQALRGSYQVFGRTFEVDGGTVSFVGQPGVNPSLNIQALSRVRRRQGDRLEVQATVTGTLVQPLVTLSTAETGLTQPDLVSYLLFGVPSGELGLTQTGGAGFAEQGVQDFSTGGALLAAGALGGQLGTALAQGIGFDYLAISQGDVVGNQDLATNFFNSLSTAQFEIGRYFGEDVFVVFVLSRPTAQSAQNTGVGVKPLRGVRVELALSDEWFVEGFVEDRFLRASGTLGQTGLDGENVVGVLIFRDWGYGSLEP